jgi:guanylate kinase
MSRPVRAGAGRSAVRAKTAQVRVRQRPGRVFVISGPSGGGKTTVVERLRRKMPRLLRSVSVTTRAPRSGERHGREYHFVSPAMFERLRRSGALVEWAKVHDAYYGTPKRPLMRALAQGRDVILNIDVQGARQVRRALGAQAVLVFLMPPSLTLLRRRLKARRTETPADLRRRLTAARGELTCASWYDHAVVNDELERAVRDVQAIVRSNTRVRSPECRSEDAEARPFGKDNREGKPSDGPGAD